MRIYQNAVFFHTGGGVLKSCMPFERLNACPEGEKRCLLCSRGCLVKLDGTASIGGEDFRMENEDRVQIRKRGAKELKRACVEYLCAKEGG